MRSSARRVGPSPSPCCRQLGKPRHHLGWHSLLRPPAGDGGLINYRILSGADGKFEIDESTGLIITVDYLDYETKTSYLMNVSATDQAPPFNQAFCSVYITLLNELDEDVQFSNASYEAAIMENLALGTEIVRVQAYSIDNINQIAYRFAAHTSAQAKALFKIDTYTVREAGPARALPTGRELNPFTASQHLFSSSCIQDTPLFVIKYL